MQPPRDPRKRTSQGFQTAGRRRSLCAPVDGDGRGYPADVRPRGNDSIVTEWRFGGVLCERQATEAPFCAPAVEDICGVSYGRQAALKRPYCDGVAIRWVLRERQATEAPFCAPAAEDILRDVGGASSRAEAALLRWRGDPQSGVSEGCAKETLCAPAAGRRDGRRFSAFARRQRSGRKRCGVDFSGQNGYDRDGKNKAARMRDVRARGVSRWIF